MNRFRNCRYVEIQPTVVGHDADDWNRSMDNLNSQMVDLGEGCFFAGKASTYERGRPTLVFGNVSYVLKDVVDGFDYASFCVIHVPIGSVDIVPSREELGMTEKTQAYIATLAEKFKKRVDGRIQEYYKEHGMSKTFLFIRDSIGKLSDFKVNGKESFIRVKVTQSASWDSLKRRVTYIDTKREHPINYNTKVIVNYEDKVVRYKPRVREYVRTHRTPVVVIKDPAEVEKYCKHFEIDESTLPHLKDIAPPVINKSTYDSKGYRFTGLRQVNVYGEVYEAGEVDLTEIDEMYFVYRKGNKLYATYTDGEYLDEITNMSMIMHYKPWKTRDIYALTYRQVTQCEKSEIDMLNVKEVLDKEFDSVKFDLAARWYAWNQNTWEIQEFARNVLLLDIIPEIFHFTVDYESSVEYSEFINGQQLYIDLNYGYEIIQKYVRMVNSFMNTDAGRMMRMIRHTYNSDKPSKEFIEVMLISAGEYVKAKAEQDANKDDNSDT